MIYEVIYVMLKENLTVHRKMTQKEIVILLKDVNIKLISVNANRVTYKRR